MNMIGDLESQLEQAKTNLKDLNFEIRKLVGRPVENERADRKRSLDGKRFSDNSTLPKRRLVDTASKSVFSRLSARNLPEDETKPKVFSRVFKEQPSREEIVAAQGTDEKSKARNRRIFGSLLVGTLQKFCQEESKLKPNAEKKAQIEKKLDEKQRREKEMLRKEKQTLIGERRKRQLEIRLIELKMLKLKEFEEWEAKQRPLGNFIRTKTLPHIYYLPKILTKKTEQRLQKSKEEIEKVIVMRQTQMHKDIASLDEQFAIEIKAAEKGLDIDMKDTEIFDSFEQGSDTEVSLIEHNIEPIALADIENFSTNNFFSTEDDQKLNKPSSVIVIKKEKLDEETHSTDE